MPYIFYQADWNALKDYIVPLGVAGISVLGTWVVMRGKNRGDLVGQLTQSLETMARRVNANVGEMEVATATINKEAEGKRTALRMVETLQSLLDDEKTTNEGLRSEAAVIIENIEHLSFVPTGEPTPDDESAIRRLKLMREAAKRMANVA